jgi:ubiquinone biosynthesis protein
MNTDSPPDWSEFCQGLDLGSLVPAEYERFRPAVVDGLIHFLQSLPTERAADILIEQATMPDDAGVGERLVAMAHRCPALHKLGQVMARDRRLPLAFRRLLQRLETMEPAHDMDWIPGELERELGPLSRLDVSIDEQPLAEASVAVVVPFVWRPGPRGEVGPGAVKRGVFKLLKPGIEQRLYEELEVLRDIGALLDERCRHYGIPEIDYESTFAQVRDLLYFEVHLDKEQEHLRMAQAAYAEVPSIVVPEVYPFCTSRVTAMERIDGRKVTDVETLTPEDRRQLADLITGALIARPIWSRGSRTLFHADPHAGNLMVTDDLRLAILDWSLVGHLSKSDQVRLSQILVGAATLDTHRIAEAIKGLAEGGIDGEALRRVVDEKLGLIRQGRLPGVSWLMDLMDSALTEARGRFGSSLVIFRKVLQTLQGVVADVSEESRADVVLAASLASLLSVEMPSRMIAPPLSRAFTSHLSNADLAHLLWSSPLIASRYWLALRRDFAAND